MKENNINVILLMIILGILMIGIGVILDNIIKDNYCNNLDLQSYIENRDKCKFIEK